MYHNCICDDFLGKVRKTILRSIALFGEAQPKYFCVAHLGYLTIGLCTTKLKLITWLQSYKSVLFCNVVDTTLLLACLPLHGSLGIINNNNKRYNNNNSNKNDNNKNKDSNNIYHMECANDKAQPPPMLP